MPRLLLLVLMLLCPQAWAAAYHDAPPSEVLEHLSRNLPDFALEDCILITGTPKGNFAFVLVNNGTSRRLLGYEPEVSFLEGLRQTVEWYRSRDGAA